MIQDLMKNASKAYYDGEPFLTNEQYDALERIHGQIVSGNGDVPHAYQMFSLQKHYEKDGTPPLDTGRCIKTPKLDGAAISILYADGDLVHVLTRGDGHKGRDITNKAQYLKIPEFINMNGLVQITGEVVARADVENSRNYASGALNLKDLSEYFQRVEEGNMIFVAYNVQNSKDWGLELSYVQDLLSIKSMGFNVITEGDYSIYPTDGEVYRLAYNSDFNAQGFTSKFPKGAFALKEEQEGVESTLLDVVWQTGKSGKVSPVGILDPIVIGEATISRATLNNIAFIEALNLEIGCRVKVVRSGEIIPQIVERVD